MKYLKLFLLIAFTITLISTKNTRTQICNYETAKNAVEPLVWFQQTTDAEIPSFIVRFFHNKITAYLNEAGKCYFSIIDPYFIYSSLGTFGFLLFTYIAYLSLTKYKPLVLLIFSLPLISFLGLSIVITQITLKIFAIIGLAVFLYKR